MTDENIVISGAGPNGLLLACELALAGVRPVVLDRLSGPSDEPKANGLVGQVIRQLDMRGLYHALGGDEGPPRPAAGWPFAGMALNFLGVEANPMHALLIPQPRLVRLLEKHARGLGVEIRWGHELVELESGPDFVAARVDVGDGHPLSGFMVPDLVLDDGRRVAELLHEARPVLLDLCGGSAAAAAGPWEDRVDTVNAGMAGSLAALLVRPDGYVAWAADTFAEPDAERMRSALTRWFGGRQRRNLPASRVAVASSLISRSTR